MRTPGRTVVLLAAALAVTCRLACGGSPDVRIATFNIEFFPREGTDPGQVAARIAEVDPDILAVQEIIDAATFGRMLGAASERTGRDYRFVLSRCGGDGRVAPGVVWDANRFTLLESRDFPQLLEDDEEECAVRHQPGVLALLADDSGRRIAPLAVHFTPFPDRFEERIEQWARALGIVDRLERELGAEVVMLGDFNSTGWRGDPRQEREFMELVLDRAERTLVSASVPCTEYWRPDRQGGFLPSMLDHIVVGDGDWSRARVHGMCEELRCRPVDDPDDMHGDYTAVSDHCPVSADLDW